MYSNQRYPPPPSTGGQVPPQGPDLRAQWTATARSLNGLVEALLERDGREGADLQSARSELELWKQSYIKSETEKNLLQAQVAELNQKLAFASNPYEGPPVALALIDGDGLVFAPSLLQKGFAGGREAAEKLSAILMKTAVDRYSATKEMQASIRGVRAMAHLYLDKKNLGATLLKARMIPMWQTWEDFLAGFTSASELFFAVDVGTGKEAADAKIKEHLRLYTSMPPCKMVILGASHDNGYSHILSALKTDARLTNVAMLRSYNSIAYELQQFNSIFVESDGLFITEKIVLPHFKPGQSNNPVSTVPGAAPPRQIDDFLNAPALKPTNRPLSQNEQLERARNQSARNSPSLPPASFAPSPSPSPSFQPIAPTPHPSTQMFAAQPTSFPRPIHGLPPGLATQGPAIPPSLPPHSTTPTPFSFTAETRLSSASQSALVAKPPAPSFTGTGIFSPDAFLSPVSRAASISRPLSSTGSSRSTQPAVPATSFAALPPPSKPVAREPEQEPEEEDDDEVDDEEEEEEEDFHALPLNPFAATMQQPPSAPPGLSKKPRAPPAATFSRIDDDDSADAFLREDEADRIENLLLAADDPPSPRTARAIELAMMESQGVQAGGGSGLNSAGGRVHDDFYDEGSGSERGSGGGGGALSAAQWPSLVATKPNVNADGWETAPSKKDKRTRVKTGTESGGGKSKGGDSSWNKTREIVRNLDPRPCHPFYLAAKGCTKPNCIFSHDHDLSAPRMMEALRDLAKENPCTNYLFGKCKLSDEACPHGHACPHMDEYEICKYGDDCRFVELH